MGSGDHVDVLHCDHLLHGDMGLLRLDFRSHTRMSILLEWGLLDLECHRRCAVVYELDLLHDLGG